MTTQRPMHTREVSREPRVRGTKPHHAPEYPHPYRRAPREDQLQRQNQNEISVEGHTSSRHRTPVWRVFATHKLLHEPEDGSNQKQTVEQHAKTLPQPLHACSGAKVDDGHQHPVIKTGEDPPNPLGEIHSGAISSRSAVARKERISSAPQAWS